MHDGQFTLRPSTIVCEEKLNTWHQYEYGMTRNAEGNVTLFLNGYFPLS